VIAIDASALVAILMEESDGAELAERFDRFADRRRVASTVSIWEAACAIARLKNCDRRLGLEIVEDFRAVSQIEAFAPDMTVTTLAVEAAQRYGMGPGRPGILNLGDCFSYATAKHLKAKLLFKGDDFGRTDVDAA
jgi:ribonuclease VapC